MKTALVLYGSARKASVSTRLCKELIRSADESIKIISFNAFALDAKPCCGCGFCERNIGCVHSDLDSFMAAFEAADYFIVSTPVYNGGVPAPLKAVVDRFQRYYALRFSHGKKPPVDKPKKAALIIAAGSEGEGKEAIEKMFIQQFTVLNTTLVGTLFVGSTDTQPLNEAVLTQARRQGELLFK